MKEIYLNNSKYTLRNALLWENCKAHYREARKGKLAHRCIHLLIAIAETLPIMSQIVSIFEKIVVGKYCKPFINVNPQNVNVKKPGNLIPQLKAQAFITQANYQQSNEEDIYQFRARIFQDTLTACKLGYQLENGKVIHIDNEPMLKETLTFDQLAPLQKTPKTYNTRFSVITEDTFQVLLKRKAEGADPVGINMANRYQAGGGAREGCPAQEEDLSRRSNHVLGLETQKYPMPEAGGIYCPHVHIFREGQAHGFAFMEQPQEISLVAVAAYDLRDGSGDRHKLGLPLNDSLDHKTLEQCEVYKVNTKNKIRNMLRMMATKGHSHLVLGALGCGAFQNPPKLVSRMFQEVFKESEFQGRFKQVDFAILKIFPNDQRNVDAFSKTCARLNRTAFKYFAHKFKSSLSFAH